MNSKRVEILRQNDLLDPVGWFTISTPKGKAIGDAVSFHGTTKGEARRMARIAENREYRQERARRVEIYREQVENHGSIEFLPLGEVK